MSRYSSSTSSTASTRPTSNGKSVQFLVGNIYQKLPSSAANVDRTGRHKKIHDWILYVDIVSGDIDIIDRVSFDLGPSFHPQSYTSQYPIPVQRNASKRAWRFYTRQQSYASLTANIRIVGRAGSVLETTHEICLSQHSAKSPLREFRETRDGSGKRPRRRMNAIPDGQRLGIELELTSDTRVSLDAVAGSLGGGDGGGGVDVVRSYGAGRVTSDRWKLVPDSSIVCSRSSPNCNKFELVSPILHGGRGLAQTSAILQRMSNIHPKLTVNKSMGFHVHIDVSSLSSRQLLKICQNFIKYETVIDTFMPPSRRDGSDQSAQYFQSNRSSVAAAVARPRYALPTNRECHDVLARNDHLQHLVAAMNSTGRYYKLNLTNLTTGRQPTIEFRQHSATISYDKVSAWIRFCVAFCRNSARFVSPKPFREGRSLEYRFDALFRYVIKDRALCEFYQERRRALMEAEERGGGGRGEITGSGCECTTCESGEGGSCAGRRGVCGKESRSGQSAKRHRYQRF